MNESDLFFVVRRNQVWACRLDGSPAFSLGETNDVLSAMREFLIEAENRNAAEVDVHTVTSDESHELGDPSQSSAVPKKARNRSINERSEQRYSITIPAAIRTTKMQHDVVLRDLSTNGCRFVEHGSYLKNGNPLTIRIGPIGPIDAVVIWRDGNFVGVKFINPMHSSILGHILSLVPHIDTE